MFRVLFRNPPPPRPRLVTAAGLAVLAACLAYGVSHAYAHFGGGGGGDKKKSSQSSKSSKSSKPGFFSRLLGSREQPHNVQPEYNPVADSSRPAYPNLNQPAQALPQVCRTSNPLARHSFGRTPAHPTAG